ncbi:MAG: lysoplasmalogenase [Bacteroidetes bacterium]|jgi:uncharacterized membrane protein YhhN|nr:lysoplasmalogenase [Bacteroidota bacterium]MDA0981200.1 lysoplasmalogenase [Bacteroidota bacterium]
MRALKFKNFSRLYLLICIVDIVVIQLSIQYSFLELICKPLIMLSIICFTRMYLKESPFYKLILIAFIFSWAGDIFLLGQLYHTLFFVAGLASFLISHILYASYFYKSSLNSLNTNKWVKGIQLLLFLYAIGFYSLMYPGLAELKTPVLFYVFTIGLMGILAVNRYKFVNSKSFNFTLIGAFSFILSDSLIGYSKFVGNIPYDRVLITIFYCLAQYLILRGFVVQKII